MAVADRELVLSESKQVFLRRYEEARQYGLTKREAYLYANSQIDCSELRRLVRVKCPPATGARILL